MPGVWDALSARLVHEAGFSTAFVSGYAVSGTLLGVPDIGYLTQTEMAEVARRTCGANPGLDLVVDADPAAVLGQVGRPVDLERQDVADGVHVFRAIEAVDGLGPRVRDQEPWVRVVEQRLDGVE